MLLAVRPLIQGQPHRLKGFTGQLFLQLPHFPAFFLAVLQQRLTITLPLVLAEVLAHLLDEFVPGQHLVGQALELGQHVCGHLRLAQAGQRHGCQLERLGLGLHDAFGIDRHHPAEVALELLLERNTCSVGRLLACRPWGAPLSVTANDNDLAFRAALFSFAGADRGEGRRHLRREGRNNRYRPGSAWVLVDGEPLPERAAFEQ